MMIALGLSLKKDITNLLVIGITPATIEALVTNQVIEIDRPAGVPYEIHLVFAETDAALVAFMRENGARNLMVQTHGQPATES